jgi:hypothetical protein
MSKLHILSETWDWFNGEITSNYLSEKTYGMVLANIPFIPTHTYPLDILEKTLGVDKYPFYDDIKNSIGKIDNFVNFIEKFFINYDDNLKLCKNWVDICHNTLIKKINSENSFLSSIYNTNEIAIIKKQKKLL